MSANTFKRLNTSDTFVVPYTANKSWDIESSSFEEYRIRVNIGTRLTGVFDPNNEFRTNGEYERLVYNTINTIYYPSFFNKYIDTASKVSTIYNDGTFTTSSYLQANGYSDIGNNNTIKFFPTSSNDFIYVINIPKTLTSDKILPNTFELFFTDGTTDGKIYDDGNYNLFYSGSNISSSLNTVLSQSSYVGNVFYEQNIAVLTIIPNNLRATAWRGIDPFCFDVSLSPTPSITPTISITPTVTPSKTTSPSITPSITVSISVTPVVTPTISVTPSITPTISETPTITPTISDTPSITPTISDTPSVTPTISDTPSVTPTISNTPSVTPSVTITPTISVTPSISISETPSVTPSISISETPSISITPTISVTPSISISETPSISISETPSISISATPSITPTISITPSITPSVTPSPSVITCSEYQIVNNGGTSISWVGNNCITNNAVGGNVSGGGGSVLTGCIRDSSFSYGDNGSVVVTSSPC